MRLFVALDIDEQIRAQIVHFLEGVRGFAPEARWVRPESLHVTLKFIGEKSEHEAEAIKRLLQTIAAEEFELNIRGFGFFPRATVPRVFCVGVEADPKLALLASKIDDGLGTLAIPKEEHPFNPHLTLARGPGGSGTARTSADNSSTHGLRCLQEKLAARPVPQFGTMTAREFFLSEPALARRFKIHKTSRIRSPVTAG